MPRNKPIMKQKKYGPISLKKEALNKGLETGQKDYALALQHAKQLDNKSDIEASTSSTDEVGILTISTPTSDPITHNGVHHANK
jgi:hypothetical protein